MSNELVTMTLTVHWEAEDGYVGHSRPQETQNVEINVNPDRLGDQDYITMLYAEVYELIYEDFQEKIQPAINMDRLISSIQEKLR